MTQVTRGEGPSFCYTVEYPGGYFRAGVSQEDLVGAELHGAAHPASAPTEADDGEQVNHPEHYGGDTTYEVIKCMEAWAPRDALGFCRMSAIKYLARAGKKDPEGEQTDYDKAAWYAARAAELNRRIYDEAEELDAGVLPSWPDTASATNNTVTYAISDPAGAKESKLAVLDAELQKRGIWRTFDEDRDIWKFFDTGRKGPRCVKLMGKSDLWGLPVLEILAEVVKAAAEVEAAERDFHANPDEEETAEGKEIRRLTSLDLILSGRNMRRTFNEDLHTHEFYLLSSAGYRPFMVVADCEVEQMEPRECAEWLDQRLDNYRRERQKQILDSRVG